MTSDPHTDALAKARELLRRLSRTGEMSAAIMRDSKRTGAWEGSERVASAFERMGDNAAEALAYLYLSAPPSQSESDDLLDHIRDATPAPSEPIDERLAASAVTFAAALAEDSGSPARVVSGNVRECMDDLGVTPRRIEAAEDDQLVEAMCAASYKTGAFVSYEAMRAALAVAVARKALTPSPSPYVRPVAEIQAEIERLNDDLSKYRSVWGPEHCEKISWRIAALTWTLTPPIQEPR